MMLKRTCDIVISLILLVILFPVFLVIAYKIVKNLGCPIIFRQIRPGLNGQPFEMLKFRSMSNAVDEKGKLLSADKRLTKFGKRLRATSLDELPELWNVVKGDMSLVGPRPLLMEYLPLYNERQKHRHDVRPGITGWAQVNGRNAISWEEKFELDVWYVNNQSFILDIKIMILTVKKVLVKEGINSVDGQIMTKFNGNVEE